MTEHVESTHLQRGVKLRIANDVMTRTFRGGCVDVYSTVFEANDDQTTEGAFGGGPVRLLKRATRCTAARTWVCKQHNRQHVCIQCIQYFWWECGREPRRLNVIDDSAFSSTLN